MLLVSIIIPVKDRASQLRRSILSILKQSGVNFEIIVVENNSIDRGSVKDVVQSLNSEKIKFFSLDNCENANVARNFGFSVSSGDLITYLDSDDEYLEGHLQSSVKLLEKHSAEFLYGSIRVYDGEKYRDLLAKPIDCYRSGAEYLFSKPKGVAPTPTYIVRRKVFEHLSWDESLARHQDLDFFIAVTNKYSVICKPEPTVLVHWPKKEKRLYSRNSMIYFYEKWKCILTFESRAVYAHDKVKLAVLNRDVFGVGYFGAIYFINVLSTVFRKILN